MAQTANIPKTDFVPKTGLAGLKENFAADLRAGLSISLIAMPLSLGIALAAGFPPVAGLISAIVAGMLVSRINGSYVTISGPAAGLIVVNLAAVQHLGGLEAAPGTTYGAGVPYAFAAFIVAGILIVLLGALGAGRIVDAVPTSVIHGMLAYIGVVIFAKMIHKGVGITLAPGEGETGKILGSDVLWTIKEIPDSFIAMFQTPGLLSVGLIGLISLIILIAHPMIKAKLVAAVPAPLWVLLVAVPLGMVLGIGQLEKTLGLADLPGKELLLKLPGNPLDAVAWIGAAAPAPDFSKLFTAVFWIAVLNIGLVTAIESGLSTKAVDQLDAYGRRSDISKDLRGVGFGGMVSGFLGGLPMISEIVRSKANVLMGARTGWANFMHGAFLLIFVFLLNPVMQLIPIAALAAMMVYVGYKLAAPAEFVHTYEIGKDQLFYFLVTLATCIFTNLLVGVFVGVIVKFLFELLIGAPLSGILKADLAVDNVNGNPCRVQVRKAAIFTNYLSLKGQLDKLPRGKKLVLDFSDARVVDYTTQAALRDYIKTYGESGGTIEVTGLERLKAFFPKLSDSLSAHRFVVRHFGGSVSIRAERATGRPNGEGEGTPGSDQGERTGVLGFFGQDLARPAAGGDGLG